MSAIRRELVPVVLAPFCTSECLVSLLQSLTRALKPEQLSRREYNVSLLIDLRRSILLVTRVAN